MSASAASSTAGSGRAPGVSRLLRLRSDDQLVAAFREGQDGAFQAIHERYRPRLFAYTRQMLGGSPQDAEDALQDVFLRAYHALRADARPITLRAWLYRVAHNRCIDQMRRPPPTPVEASEETPSGTVDPLVATQQREDLRRLVSDIGALPQQQRSALLMREMDGMSYTELGAALGVTVPAVKSLLVRARMGLAEAGEARDAACEEIRGDLADSHDRGVRSSARSRRHMRECRACRGYRGALRSTSSGIAALIPASPGLLAGLVKVLGLGGTGSGALIGGAGAAGAGSSAAAVGVTTAKVAAVLGAATMAAGGAGQVEQRLATRSQPPPQQAASPSPPPAPSVAPGAPAPDTVMRTADAQGSTGGAKREEGAGSKDSAGEASRKGTPGDQAQGPPAGSTPAGRSDGGPSSGGDAGSSPEGGRREPPVDRLVRVPGEVVSGALDTVRRATGSVSGSSDGPATATDQPAGTTATATSNDSGAGRERRPRGAESGDE